MKYAAITFAMAALLAAAAGCGTTKPPGDQGESFVEMPTIIIQTTKGNINVVLFPKIDPTNQEKHYDYFTKCIESGWFDNCKIASLPGPHNYYEEIDFIIQGRPDLTGTAVPTKKSDTIQPVRGTLYMKEIMRGDGIFADPTRVVILKKGSQDTGHPEVFLPNAGQTLCIGQVDAGLDVLDKLDAEDTVLKITQGPKRRVSVARLAKLGFAEMSNFADVLRGD
jgi:cyclophilin family peptidyl-prolyl cis-trans isomerase